MSPLLLLLLLLAGAPSAKTDPAKDRSDCANTLAGLATCLAYVQGSSGAPSPDCCTGLKGVLANSPKCLCVLIRDRDDPQLGLHIDLNRALTLPDTCRADANISRCPELLNLPPNSPSAQIFKNITAGNTAPAKEGSAKDKGSSSSNAHETSHGTRIYNHQFEGEKQWRVTKLSFVTLLLTLAFMAG